MEVAAHRTQQSSVVFVLFLVVYVWLSTLVVFACFVVLVCGVLISVSAVGFVVPHVFHYGCLSVFVVS